VFVVLEDAVIKVTDISFFNNKKTVLKIISDFTQERKENGV